MGTAWRNGNVQRLDAFALNSLPHTGMKRVCYEVKASRSDFLAELKHPLKRRIGMRYSNEFYFVTSAQLVHITEIPAECGLVEAGVATADEWKRLIRRHAGFFSFDPRYAALLHDHRSGSRGATRRPHLATGRRHAAESTARDGGKAASPATPRVLFALSWFVSAQFRFEPEGFEQLQNHLQVLLIP